MLTKNDLTQIKTIVEDVVDSKLKKELQPIKIDLNNHNNEFKSINDKLNNHDKEFKSVHKELGKIHKDIKIVINYFDNNHLNHEKRITKIENHLGFSRQLV